MTINEHQRYQLHQVLGTTLGPEDAATLMAHLPPVGSADVATKADLLALETRMDLRIENLGNGLRAEFQRNLRVGMLAVIAANAAVVSLIAALTKLF